MTVRSFVHRLSLLAAIYLASLELCVEADACRQAGTSRDPLPAEESSQRRIAGIWSKIFETWRGRSYDVEVEGVTLDIGITDIQAEELGIRCDTNGSRLIYVRQAYRALFERLEKHEKVKRLISHPGGVVITGQPGTGVFACLGHVAELILRRKNNFHLVHGSLLPHAQLQLRFLFRIPDRVCV